MSESILNSTKAALMLGEDYTVFDPQIIMYINAVLSDLEQLGVGPPAGFAITDADAVWSDFLGNDPRLNNVRSYVTLRTRLLFDPPTTSYTITAFERQVKELEWRINVRREDSEWIDPDPPVIDEEETDLVIDGGPA